MYTSSQNLGTFLQKCVQFIDYQTLYANQQSIKIYRNINQSQQISKFTISQSEAPEVKHHHRWTYTIIVEKYYNFPDQSYNHLNEKRIIFEKAQITVCLRIIFA